MTFPRNPIRRIVSDLTSAGSVIANLPLSLATPPIVVPVTMTCAFGMGVRSVASTMWPVARVCDSARVVQIPSNTTAPSAVATRVAFRRTHIARCITHLQIKARVRRRSLSTHRDRRTRGNRCPSQWIDSRPSYRPVLRCQQRSTSPNAGIAGGCGLRRPNRLADRCPRLRERPQPIRGAPRIDGGVGFRSFDWRESTYPDACPALGSEPIPDPSPRAGDRSRAS